MKHSYLLIWLLWGILAFPQHAFSNTGHKATAQPAASADCTAPGTPVVNVLSSVSARAKWGKAINVGAVSYEWELGAVGFLPGTSAFLQNGTVLDTNLLLTGLPSSGAYTLAVRAVCEDQSGSDWVLSADFSTPPGCGELWYDSGGPLANYADGSQTLVTFCANQPTEVVTLDFGAFELGFGDTMRIYDGSSVFDPELGTFYLGGPIPTSFSATTASGCITVQFGANASNNAEGWEASISCAPPTECSGVPFVNVFNLQPESANFSWPAMFGAIGYKWEMVTLGGMITANGFTASTSVQVQNLVEATNYNFRVTPICVQGEGSTFAISFATPIDCDGLPVLQCGESTNSGIISVGGLGVWETDACGSYAKPGKERIFRFTAPNTKEFVFEVLSVAGPNNPYVTYAYKEASKGCGPFGWECIGSFLVPSSTTFGPLIAGKEYYILFDAEKTSFTSQSFRIRDCKPVNDEAENAIDIPVNSVCSGNIYSNDGATYNAQDLEPDPDAEENDVDKLVGRWLTGASETVWFKFDAPPSGSVIISTETFPQGGNFDTQLALYETDTPEDYGTFRLLASDDDNGNIGLGFNSIFSYTGLMPGQTYYVQLDGFSFIEGNFCIQIKEGVKRIAVAECEEKYFAPKVNGTEVGGDRWYNIFTQPDNLDLGDLVSAVKPGPQKLDTVFCEVAVYEEIPISGNSIPYMPAYFNFSTNADEVDTFLVRLFFSNAEFDSLKVKANAPTATIDDLVATYYVGTNEDCIQNNNFVGGVGLPTLITDITAVPMSASNNFYLEFKMPGMGEVGAHLGTEALPIEMSSFEGEIAAAANRLTWVTRSERNVAWHLVERAANGSNWQEIGRRPGQMDSQETTRYTFDDSAPLPVSYYRIRSVDTDGSIALSQAIVLRRDDLGLGISRVFPSPSSDRVWVDFFAPSETNLRVRVTDLNGRTLLETNFEAAKGQNSMPLSLRDLPPGVYALSLQDGASAMPAIRIVKQ